MITAPAAAPVAAAPTADAQSGRRELWALLAILGVAAIVRLLLPAVGRLIRFDEPDYLTLGINLFSGRGYTTGVVPELHYTPLFPIASGLAYLLVRNAEMASDIVYLIAGVLLILPVYAIARRIYGRNTGLLVAAILAVFPALTASVLFWGTMTEPLYILLVYAGFFCLLLAVEEDRVWPFAAAGALLSLAYLTRPEASITFALAVAYVIAVRLAQRRLLNRRTVLRLAALVLAFALVAAPYLGFLYAKSGRLLISGKLGLTYEMGQAVLNKDPAEYDRLIASLDATGNEIIWYSPERFNYSVIDDLLADPAAFARRTAANARIFAGQMFSHTMFPTFLAIPVLLGLMSGAWDRRRLRQEAFLLTIILAPIVSFLPFHIEIRFFAPAMPALLIWAAHGLLVIGEWLVTTWQTLELHPGERTRRILAVLPAAAVVLYFAAITPLVVRAAQAGLDETHKQAGLWLRDNTPPGSTVMARDLAVAVYAQRPWIPSPNAEYDKTMAYAKNHGANYFVTDDYEIKTLRPQLADLLDEQNPPAGLAHEETLQDGKRRTLIYRVE